MQLNAACYIHSYIYCFRLYHYALKHCWSKRTFLIDHVNIICHMSCQTNLYTDISLSSLLYRWTVSCPWMWRNTSPHYDMTDFAYIFYSFHAGHSCLATWLITLSSLLYRWTVSCPWMWRNTSPHYDMTDFAYIFYSFHAGHSCLATWLITIIV